MVSLTTRMSAMKRAALYARVSTRNGHQDPETQLMALRQVAERAGWQVVEEYVDHGISGANGRDQRPVFDRLMKDAIRAARAAGKGQLAIARDLGVGVSTVRGGAGRRHWNLKFICFNTRAARMAVPQAPPAAPQAV